MHDEFAVQLAAAIFEPQNSETVSSLVQRSHRQVRRLRFANGRDNYGERSEPEKYFCSRGIIPPETAKLTMPE
jgi:hypothetical protein